MSVKLSLFQRNKVANAYVALMIALDEIVENGGASEWEARELNYDILSIKAILDKWGDKTYSTKLRDARIRRYEWKKYANDICN